MADCRDSTSAAIKAIPAGIAVLVVVVDAPFPPSRKAAAMSTRKASALSELVMFCDVLPQMIPRHCKTAKTIATTTAIATASGFPLSRGKRAPANSPIRSETPAAEPHVEIQSLQPTRKPAYSPNAWRAKTYCPPDFGIIAEFG